MRGTMQPRRGPPAASAAASATEARRSASITRSERRHGAGAGALRDRLAATSTSGTPSAAAAAAMPGSSALAAGVAIMSSVRSAMPARASAAAITAVDRGRRGALAGIRRPRRSWLHPAPLRHRHGRTPARSCSLPTGSARAIAMRISSPPQRRMARDQQRLGLKRHGIDHEPAAGAQRRHRGIEHARHRWRRRRRRSHPGAAIRRARPAPRPATISRPGTPKLAALRRMRAARSRARLDRDRAQRRIGQHPFDRDRSGAGADVPQQFAAPRRQRRQRHRAHLALGDLAVVLEQRVGQAGGARDDARARLRPRPRSPRC